MTAVLTVSALDFGADKLINYMARVCRRFAVSDGRTQVQVKYPAMLDPDATGSIAVGCENLNKLIRTIKGPKIVLGYSQGAQVCGSWLTRYANNALSPPPAELSFVLIGNPERRFGRQPWTKRVTPDDTRYSVRDVARRHDNWADYDPSVHPKNKLAAMFGKIHTNYWNVDVYDTSAETVAVNGNTTYVRVP